VDRKAEYRSDRAQDEMRNLISNANLLDEKVSDYKINSTFENCHRNHQRRDQKASNEHIDPDFHNSRFLGPGLGSGATEVLSTS